MGKKTKTKKDRSSKASRLSTQSVFTAASEAPSFGDLPTEEGDSILTTATNATAVKKMGKGKKASAKGRKTKKKIESEPEPEAVQVMATSAPEPEDDDFEPKVVVAPKSTRGRKRKTEDTLESVASVVELAPPAKRRTTRTRGSVAVDDSVVDDGTVVHEPSKKTSRKGRASTRKASTASVVPARDFIPNDDDIDAALEADLERQATDDEAPTVISKKLIMSSKTTTSDHDMFGTKPMEIDEAEIDAELEAMEVDMKPLPKAKGAKGKQLRKVSAKQQAAAKKAAEAAAAAEQHVEDDPSEQIAMELENSISMQHSSPILQPKKQRATSHQPQGRKGTRASALSVSDRSVSTHNPENEHKHHADSGNETDVSIESQSTVVRGGKAGRSTTKKGMAGKNISKNIEDIVHISVDGPDKEVFLMPGNKDTQPEDVSMADENYYTPAPEVQLVVSATGANG